MKRPHIITLSGKPGSGKSSTADQVAELLGYSRFSSGDMVRQIVKRHGMTLAEFNARAIDNHALDHDIDEELRKLRTADEIVIDSRLGFYWIPESFKVYLDLDIDVAATRIYTNLQENSSRSVEGNGDNSLAEVARSVRARMQNEQSRYKALYGVDPYDTERFDLIINTSRHSPQTVALTIFDTYKQWLQTETWNQVFSEVPLGFSHKNQY